MTSKTQAFDLEAINNLQNARMQLDIRWAISASHFKRAYKLKKRDFASLIMQDGEFRAEAFEGIDFSNSCFRDIDFRESSFQRCDFSYCTFNNCNLSGVDFKTSDLSFVRLYNCDLSFCKFQNVTMSIARIDGCNARHADFSGAILNQSEMYHLDLYGAKFNSSDLSDASLYSCNLMSVDFSNTNLRNSVLQNVVLIEANFDKANIDRMCGIYSAFGVSMSSRKDSLYGGIEIVDNKIELRFWAGCKFRKTQTELMRLLDKKYPNGGIHYEQYIASMAYMKRMFEFDMQNGTWDYLILKFP